MKINEAIKDILKEHQLPLGDGIACLLMMYFDYKPSYLPKEIEERIKRTGIIKADPTHTIQWVVPLFEEQVTGFEWITDWMQFFGNVNKERRGSKSSVASRMKKFFVTYPDIRQQDVITATKLYISTVDNPKYIKKSEKFIFEGVGLEKTSLLKEWVDKYREMSSSQGQRKSTSNTMK